MPFGILGKTQILSAHEISENNNLKTEQNGLVVINSDNLQPNQDYSPSGTLFMFQGKKSKDSKQTSKRKQRKPLAVQNYKVQVQSSNASNNISVRMSPK